MINQELIDFSNHLADLSCNIVHKYFRKNIGEKNKIDDTPVTLADQEIEKIIRDEIIKKYPNHGIIGEEYDNINLTLFYELKFKIIKNFYYNILKKK